MYNGFQFMAISQLAQRFPADSWWAKFYKDFSEDDLVAYYEGDLTLPPLIWTGICLFHSRTRPFSFSSMAI